MLGVSCSLAADGLATARCKDEEAYEQHSRCRQPNVPHQSPDYLSTDRSSMLRHMMMECSSCLQVIEHALILPQSARKAQHTVTVAQTKKKVAISSARNQVTSDLSSTE